MDLTTVSSKESPYANYNYKVLIFQPKIGTIYAGFSSVTGMGITVNFSERRQGGNNKIPDKFVESISDSPVVLSKGMSKDVSLVEFMAFLLKPYKNVIGHFSKLFSVEIEVRNRDNTKKVKTIIFDHCKVESFNIGDLEANGSEILLESFSFRYQYMRIE